MARGERAHGAVGRPGEDPVPVELQLVDPAVQRHLVAASDNAALLVDDEITIAIQVNGKLRGSITVRKDADREAIEKLALANENVMRFIEGQAVKKMVVVPGRLVNIVV